MTVAATALKSSITHKELFDAVVYEFQSAQQSEAKYIAYFKADPEKFENAVDYTYNFMRKAFLKTILDGMDLMDFTEMVDWLTGQLAAMKVFYNQDSVGTNHWSALAYENRQKLGTYKIGFLDDLIAELTKP